MRWAGHAAQTGQKRNACRVLVGEPEGKRPLGRRRRKSVDNIKIDLREIGWGCIDWIDLAQDRDECRTLVNTVMNLGFHKMFGISSVAAQMAASQEWLSSMKVSNLVS
jgi:hypothetical protein